MEALPAGVHDAALGPVLAGAPFSFLMPSLTEAAPWGGGLGVTSSHVVTEVGIGGIAAIWGHLETPAERAGFAA